MRRQLSWLLTAVCLFSAVAAFSQSKPDAAPEFEVKAHYTKYEFWIPMRDGVHLFTSIYVPKDTSKPYPFLINRTPYSVAPLRRGQLPQVARAIERVRKGGIYFREPGCSRTVYVGRQIR